MLNPVVIQNRMILKLLSSFQQKQCENEQALKHLSARFEVLDKISDDHERSLKLARGLLAGNVFDWGAKEVVEIMEKGEFKFEDAESKLQGKVTVFSNQFKKNTITLMFHYLGHSL